LLENFIISMPRATSGYKIRCKASAAGNCTHIIFSSYTKSRLVCYARREIIKEMSMRF